MACFGIDADDASASTPFGKVGCSEAEELLEGCGLPRDSPGSRAALRKYCEEQEGRNVSLLECGLEQLVKEQKDSVSSERRRDADCEDDNLVSSSYQKPCHVRSKGIEEVVFARNSTDKVKAGVEERLHAIQIGLEKDKNIQLQMAINKYLQLNWHASLLTPIFVNFSIWFDQFSREGGGQDPPRAGDANGVWIAVEGKGAAERGQGTGWGI